MSKIKTEIMIRLITDTKWDVQEHEELLRKLSKKFNTTQLWIESKPIEE